MQDVMIVICFWTISVSSCVFSSFLFHWKIILALCVFGDELALPQFAEIGKHFCIHD